MNWERLDTGEKSAKENMELDRVLLRELATRRYPLLHLYDWAHPSATYGHFIAPEKFLAMEEVEARGLDLARRPTGGGIIFHTCDLAFSLLMPAHDPAFSQQPLDNYIFVNERVKEAIFRFNGEKPELLPLEPLPLSSACSSFCMAKPTKYDLMLGGKKVGGAAQRKTRFGYLHQGSIALGSVDLNHLACLRPGTEVLSAMTLYSRPLLGPSWSSKQLQGARKELKHLLWSVFNAS